MRERIWQLVTDEQSDQGPAQVYDWFMIGAILLSLLPLCFKETPIAFVYLEEVTTVVFIVDYLLRWMCADLIAGQEQRADDEEQPQRAKDPLVFLLYPLTPLAIVDFVSIVPTFVRVPQMLRLSRIVRLLRLMRTVKLVHHSRSVQLVLHVLRRERDALLAVLALALGYVFVSALIVFNVEPGTFDSFFDALYWAVTSLSTIGYGDIYATSVAGRVVSMVSALMGIAVVALPSGIITVGFVEELRQGREEEEAADEDVCQQPEEHQDDHSPTI